MNYWLYLVLGALGGALISILALRKPEERAESRDIVVVRRPRVWLVIAALIVVGTPLALMMRAVRGYEMGADVLLTVTIVPVLLCIPVVLIGLHRIAFSAMGIEAQVSIVKFQASWDEIREIKARRAGTLSSLQFIKDSGRKIEVNATMLGWSALLRSLPELTTGTSKEKAIRAVEELERVP